MADVEDDGITVNVDDLDVVNVDVGDAPKLAQEPEHIKQEIKKTEKKAKKERVSPEREGPTPEEVLAQTQAFAKQQEDARKAAEATAASERALREQAQREALQAQQTAKQLEERAVNSELAAIENGIANATQQIETLEAEYTRAAEAGEFAKMGSIQTKISRAAAQLDRLETAKENFGSTTTTQTTEGRVEAPAQQSAFDRYLSQFAPVAQNWLRQHPECVPANMGGNAAKHNAMMKGHYAALEQGLQEGTTEYFRVIEDTVSPPSQQQTIAQPGVSSRAAEIQVAGEPRQQRQVPVAAPVTRDPPTAQGQPRSVREVRLTKDQQDMAKVSFPHLPEAQAYGQYARNLIELEAEGKLGRTSH